MASEYCSICGSVSSPHSCWATGLKAAQDCIKDQRTGNIGMAMGLGEAVASMAAGYSDLENEVRHLRRALGYIYCVKYRSWDSALEEDGKRWCDRCGAEVVGEKCAWVEGQS